MPEPWQPFARTDKQAVKHVSLQLPYSHGDYPEEWGRTPFPPERGPYSTAFQQWLRRDVKNIWVDVDTDTDPGMFWLLGLVRPEHLSRNVLQPHQVTALTPAREALAQERQLTVCADGKRDRVETMAQAPMWLLSRWIEIGERLGAWNLNPPMGVINHVLVPGGRDNVLKSGIMKIYGWWHWDVNRMLRGPGLVASAAKVRIDLARSTCPFRTHARVQRNTSVMGCRWGWAKMTLCCRR